MQLVRKSVGIRRIPVALLFIWAMFGAAAAHAGDAKVVLVIGKGEFQEPAGGPWKSIQEGQTLPVGATVRTGDSAQLALLLSDQTQLRVSKGSSLKIRDSGDASQETVLDLLEGRIWAQVKRSFRAATAFITPRRSVTVNTPTATIGIRGTDWDAEVGEKKETTVTVLSGVVEMVNDFGAVALGPNEQAIAEVGKAPSKRLISNARDRVQWVTSYRPNPTRWVEQVPPSLQAASRAIESARYGEAARLLDNAPASKEKAILRADMLLYGGEAGQAIELLGAQSIGDDDRATALLGRALTIAGRFQEARSRLADFCRLHPSAVESRLALADLERLEGDAGAALDMFSQVAGMSPDRHESWFGVGRIQNEKEDFKAAGAALEKALGLSPDAPGYLGEFATTKALSGDYLAAEKAFAEALRRQPDDFLAWTGLGILQLKTGRDDAALESFLKAGVLEPRLARSWLYVGVAYYRLGNRERAIESANKAAELDPKDPLPHVMLALIRSDALELAAATEAARQAQARMPYLKSLNQLMNNQKGNANLGSSLAAQGMEEWARALAAETNTPFWAGSALFLADRYPDGYNKNSELYRGFLLDPTVFGASNRESSLIVTPGHYGSIAYLGTRADFSQQVAQGKLNGLTATSVPLAYSLTAEYADGNDTRPNSNTFQAHGTNMTIGLGARPSYDAGIFYFGNLVDVRGHFSDPAQLPDARLNVKTDRHDLGISYRIAPENQLWVKLGTGDQRTRLAGSQIDATNAAALSIPAVLATTQNATLQDNAADVTQNDGQFRHSFALRGRSRITWGYGDSHDRMSLSRLQQFPTTLTSVGGCLALGLASPCAAVIPMQTTVRRDLRSTDLFASLIAALTESVDLQYDLDYQRVHTTGNVAQSGVVTVTGTPSIPLFTQVQTERDTFEELNHRIGFRYGLAPGKTLRAAYQRWRRPFGPGSLGLTETAGIPIEDRLVDGGGLLRRGKVRLDWELSPRQFLQFAVDKREVNNLQSVAMPFFRQFGLTELAALRARKPVFDEAFDELERTPTFGEGNVSSASVAGNFLLTDQTTFAARYQLASSRNTAAAFTGRVVPLVPKHFFNLSLFHDFGNRWLASTSATYRSSRYRDEANASPLDAGWILGFRTYWESSDRRWLVEAALNNVHSNKNAAVERRVVFDLTSTYRF